MESWAQLQPQSNLYNLFFFVQRSPTTSRHQPPFHCPRNLVFGPPFYKTNEHGSQFGFQSGAIKIPTSEINPGYLPLVRDVF